MVQPALPLAVALTLGALMAAPKASRVRRVLVSRDTTPGGLQFGRGDARAWGVPATGLPLAC